MNQGVHYRVPSSMRSFAASVANKVGVPFENVPGITHKGNRGRGATGGYSGVNVRDRRFSGARHFELRIRHRSKFSLDPMI